MTDAPEQPPVLHILQGLCAYDTNSCLIQWPSKDIWAVSGERARVKDRVTDIQASNVKIFLKLSKIRTTRQMLVLAVKLEPQWVSLL